MLAIKAVRMAEMGTVCPFPSPKIPSAICSLFRGNAHNQIMTAMPSKSRTLPATPSLPLSGIPPVRFADLHPAPPALCQQPLQPKRITSKKPNFACQNKGLTGRGRNPPVTAPQPSPPASQPCSYSVPCPSSRRESSASTLQHRPRKRHKPPAHQG